MPQVKRLRVFAGPNGSGKTTVFRQVAQSYRTGPFVNADEIQRALRIDGAVSLSSLGVSLRNREWEDWLSESRWVAQLRHQGRLGNIRRSGNSLCCTRGKTGSYDAAIISAFVRTALLARGKTFSLETVMSHPSKIAFITQAAALGYRTYLYFICTENPAINVARVKQRVLLGEHDVPEEKVRSRYTRSLRLLSQAISSSYRSFLFDNSGKEYSLLLEFKEGSEMTVHRELVPDWALKGAVAPLFPEILDD